MSPLMFATIMVGLVLLFGFILPFGGVALVVIGSIKRSQRAIDRMDAEAEQAELARKERQNEQLRAVPASHPREFCHCPKARTPERYTESEARLQENHARSEALLLARIKDLERVQILLIAEIGNLQTALFFGEVGRQYLLRQKPKDYRHWQNQTNPIPPTNAR